jgi:hypothetical protein
MAGVLLRPIPATCAWRFSAVSIPTRFTRGCCMVRIRSSEWSACRHMPMLTLRPSIRSRWSRLSMRFLVTCLLSLVERRNGCVQDLFQPVQGNIRQYGRTDTPLWASFFSGKPGSIVYHTGFESLVNSSAEAGKRVEFGQQRRVVDSVETFGDIYTCFGRHRSNLNVHLRKGMYSAFSAITRSIHTK